MGILLSKQDHHLNEPDTIDSHIYPKKRRKIAKRSSEDTEPVQAAKKLKTVMGHDSKLVALHSETVSTPTPRRKRKTPSSPYFNTENQLPSPSPTPTKASTQVKRAKVSVIETFGGPPSELQHFRPTSPNEFGLIQEKLRDEPWKMLVAVIFLNKTTAKMALPLLAQLFEQWPTPERLSNADVHELATFLYPIGLYNVRAKRLIDFSTKWISDPPQREVLKVRKGLKDYPPTAISHLPGVSDINQRKLMIRWVSMHWIRGGCFVLGRKSGDRFSRRTKNCKHG